MATITPFPLPPEILTDIFALCDSSSDMLSLALTCRRSYEIWRANVVCLLWPLWRRTLVDWKEALITVSTGLNSRASLQLETYFICSTS